MAAITVSADTFLDTAPGTRAPGDTVTFSNAVTFTIRTDTRWYAGAPAGMTGTLGATAPFRGAKYHIDGTKVRMIPFTGGNALVPPINTVIKQAGHVTVGTLLAVYPNLVSAPVAPGQPMPFSGFLKFREVFNGPFLPNAEFTNIPARANGPERAGWIEVVYEGNSTVAAGANGDGLTITGEWFDLGVTTGTPGQLIQCPTNGGGANTYINGVQIETAPGSGVFEWYPSLMTTDKFTTTSLSTDIRSKFVQFISNGQVRIGSDGTNLIGYTPVAGCAIRIPNIFIRSVAAAARATNIFPAAGTARPILSSGAGTKYSADKVHLETSQMLSGNSAKFTNSICELPPSTVDLPAGDFSGSCIAAYLTTAGTRLALTRCANMNISNIKLSAKTIATFTGNMVLLGCNNIFGDNIEIINIGVQGSGNYCLQISMSDNIRFNRLKIKGGTFNLPAKVSNSTFTNIDYVDNVVGTTTAGPAALISIDTSNNVLFDGITSGENGVIPGVAWYGNLLANGTYGNDNITVRNVGSPTAPINVGTNPAMYPNNLLSAAAVSRNIKMQRVYVGDTRSTSGLFASLGGPYLLNSTFEYLYAGTKPTLGTGDSPFVDTKRSGMFINSAAINNGNATSIDSSWADYFSPDLDTTTGSLVWVGNPPNTNLGTDYIVSESPYSGYLGTAISLGNIGDVAYTEMSYYAKGHTGFQNAAPVVKGVTPTSYLIEYQIDTGNGFSAVWKTLNGENLSNETVSPAGFKLRLRFTLTSTVAASTSQVSAVHIATTTSAIARAENQYPLDVVTLSFEGLVPGSEIRAYEGTDPATAVQIGGVESVGGSTWSFTHSSSGKQGYIHIFAMGYQPVMIPRTYAFTDSSLLIQQVIDRNYLNP